MRTLPILPAALMALCMSAVAPAADKTFEKQLPAEPQGIVEISNTAGSVHVAGWDRPEVSVRAELEEGVERVDMDSDHGRVNIKVVLPSTSRHPDARLRVQVPRGSELHVTTVSADQTLAAVSGVQRLSSVSGDVSSEVAGADLELKTVSGDIG